MKKSIFLIALILASMISFAQHELIVKKGARGLYISHTVTPKETFYSVGRMYNVPAKEIANFNKLEMSQGLTIGKVINIPLSSGNFTQEKQSGKPVYYVVGKNEGLFRVSATNNNVLMANLRKWNQLTSDQVNAGQKIIIGYLLTDQQPAVSVAPAPVVEKKEAAVEPARPIATEPAADAVVKKQEEKKPVIEKPVPVRATPVANVNPGADGYFKSQYLLQIKIQAESKDETMAAGIFKTSSGWEDKKYYVLMDNVEPGTIVKIINPNNNRAVYAKVLDKVSGIRQNQGYDLRMSNAAAVALDIADTDKFFVRLVY